jgi:hypothetical protein
MTAANTDPPVGEARIHELLWALREVLREFDSIARLAPHLFFERFFAEAYSDDDWDSFIENNADRGWDTWMCYADYCDRFFGSSQWFEHYKRLSMCAYDVMAELGTLIPLQHAWNEEPTKIPRLEYVFREDDEPYLVWTDLVFQAAHVNGPLIRRNDDKRELVKGKPSDGDGADHSTLYPTCVAIVLNLFRSSAEAIRLFLGECNCCHIKDAIDFSIVLLQSSPSSVSDPPALLPAAYPTSDVAAHSTRRAKGAEKFSVG